MRRRPALEEVTEAAGEVGGIERSASRVVKTRPLSFRFGRWSCAPCPAAPCVL
jgi:hypothetical protein